MNKPWYYPVPGHRNPLTDSYLHTEKYYSAARGHQHRGIDIPAPKGQNIAAAFDGWLWFPSWGDAYGNHFVLVDDHSRYGLLYAHLDHFANAVEIPRRRGNVVRVCRGQYLGGVGQTGQAYGPHLHLEGHPNYRNWRATENIFADLEAAR